jgi:hypothetical protein
MFSRTPTAESSATMKVWGIGRREYELFEDEDGNQWLWAFCEVPNCPNQVCAKMNDQFCWPHLMTGGEVKTVVASVPVKTES